MFEYERYRYYTGYFYFVSGVYSKFWSYFYSEYGRCRCYTGYFYFTTGVYSKFWGYFYPEYGQYSS